MVYTAGGEAAGRGNSLDDKGLGGDAIETRRLALRLEGRERR